MQKIKSLPREYLPILHFGQGSKETITTAEQAIEWVRENAKKGADGIKFFGAAPTSWMRHMEENKKLGLRILPAIMHKWM